MYRLIASDMDETFLGRGHRMPPENLEAMARLRELGVLFVPCSGRPYPSIRSNFDSIDPQLLADGYVISFNGCCIHRVGDPDPLISIPLDRAMAETLYRNAREKRIPLHVYPVGGTIYIQDIPQEELDRIRDVAGMTPVDHDVDIMELIGDEPIAKILYMDPDLARVKRIAAETMPLLDPDKVSVTYSSNRYAEFVPAHTSKGTGLAHLAAHLGIDIAETIGMGDSANDLGMIYAAGMGVAVANATSDVKDAAGLVLESTCEDGALAEVVRRLVEPDHVSRP